MNLEDLRIASPCSASWENMIGDDQVRFCNHCRKNVYNLSSMTRSEAENLITRKEGKLCAMLYRRKDGTVLTTDCPVGRKGWRKRMALRVACLMTILAAPVLSLFRTSTQITGGITLGPKLMGAIAIPQQSDFQMGKIAVTTTDAGQKDDEQKKETLKSLGYVDQP